MREQTTFAQTSIAGRAAEFFTVTDVMAAFAALYGSVDELKHCGSCAAGRAQSLDAIATPAA
jgi:hypothetical protein